MRFLYFVIFVSIPVSVLPTQNPAAEEDSGSQTKLLNFLHTIKSAYEEISYAIEFLIKIQEIFGAVFSGKQSGDPFIARHMPEDAYLNISQLVTKYGYPFEQHQVTTDDGYKLNIHRLPHGKNSTRKDGVVFLMHGLLDSSDSWVLQGPDNALAYILADQGYDVWMGNARGNKHALEHVTLNPRQSSFWNFTWEQIGLYDLPATIDYVLNTTGHTKLFYIGHSQGTTTFYVMNSLRPEYNEKVAMMFSLAPVAWMREVKSPIVQLFSPAHNILHLFLSNLNTYSPTMDFFNKITSVFCNFTPLRCDNILYLIVGDKNSNVNETTLATVFGHLPSGSSTLQLVHYGQLVESGRFCRFDYGIEKNLKEYGLSTPPNYDLSKLNVPIVIYYSANDWLSDPADVEILKSNLPNVVEEHFIENFNHMDYMFASVAKELIYDKIVHRLDYIVLRKDNLLTLNKMTWPFEN